MDTPKHLTALAEQLRAQGIQAELVLAVTEPQSGASITIRYRRGEGGQVGFFVEKTSIAETEHLIRALNAVTSHLKSA